MYSRCGRSILEQAKDEDAAALTEAKLLLLKACEVAPTASTWLGVGKVCFRLKEYNDAEDAFSVRFLRLQTLILFSYCRKPICLITAMETFGHTLLCFVWP